MILGNRGTTEAVGQPQDAYLGRRADEFLADPVQARAIMANDRRIMESGKAGRVEEVLTRPDGATAVFLSTKAPLRDAAGAVVGLVGASLDITERKAAEAALAESEALLRFAFEAAGGVGTWDWDLVADRVRVTGDFARLYGLDPARAAEGVPPRPSSAASTPPTAPRWTFCWARPSSGAATSAPSSASSPLGARRAGLSRVGAASSALEGRPTRSLAWSSTRPSVTPPRRRCARARPSSNPSWLLAPLGVAFFDRDHRWIAINEELAAINGFSVADHLGRRIEDLLPVNAVHVGPVIDRIFASGEAVRHVEVTGEVPAMPGVPRHWLVNYDPVRGPEGEVAAVGTWVVEITERKEAEARALEESRVLETLNRAGAALAGELDLDRLLQRLVDDAVDITGAAYGAFFHNVMDDTGERLHLFTLSGRSARTSRGWGGVRATGVFGPTFRNEGVVRADDIQADPRYGLFEPHNGMPAGHLPVRSYLAVPVVSRGGAVLGGAAVRPPRARALHRAARAAHPRPGRAGARWPSTTPTSFRRSSAPTPRLRRA
jgi:PAS domain S-box-containing protein